MFGQFFGGHGHGHGQQQRQQPGKRKGDSAQLGLNIPLLDFIMGKLWNLMLK